MALGIQKQACKMRPACFKEPEQKENEDSEEKTDSKKRGKSLKKEVNTKKNSSYLSEFKPLISSFKSKDFVWLDPNPVRNDERTFYRDAKIGICTERMSLNYFLGIHPIRVGSVVSLEGEDQHAELELVQIVSMWEDSRSQKCFHGRFLLPGSSTVLADTSSPHELFLLDKCMDLSVYYIVAPIEVAFHEVPKDWKTLGGEVFPGYSKSLSNLERILDRPYRKLLLQAEICARHCEIYQFGSKR